jgi:ligand-binding sensor domain-containing protein
MQPRIAAAVVLASCGAVHEEPIGAEAADPRQTQAYVRGAAQIAEYVVAAFEDRQGNLWFGTIGQGVACYQPSTSPATVGALRYFSVGDGLIDDVVTDIAEDREGRLWFGTHAGASRYDPSAQSRSGGNVFTGFGSEEGLRGSGCKLLIDRRGELWAGTSAGAFRFDGKRFHAFELPIPVLENPSYKIVSGKVWDLLEDHKGNIWFARDGLGACKFDPALALEPDGQPFTLFTQRDGLCSNNVASIVEDAQGCIWFGSITSDHPEFIAEGGLSRYDPTLPSGARRPAFEQFPALEGLTANDIYNLYVDRAGNVWIGAVRVGAYRYDPLAAGRSGDKPFTLFDTTNRPDLTTVFGVQAIEQDRHGTLWFGFSGGLFRFNGTSFVNVTQGGPWASP